MAVAQFHAEGIVAFAQTFYSHIHGSTGSSGTALCHLVIDRHSILYLTLKGGLAVGSQCRYGECHLCRGKCAVVGYYLQVLCLSRLLAITCGCGCAGTVQREDFQVAPVGKHGGSTRFHIYSVQTRSVGLTLHGPV